MSKPTKKRTAPRIKTGHSGKLVKRISYPFNSLKRPGDFFRVEDIELDNSVRVQASKQSKIRKVKYSVSRVNGINKLNGRKTQSIVVQLEGFI